jgi:cytochrome c553
MAGVRAGAEVDASPRLVFVIPQTMTKSIRDSKKSKPKIGRPKTTGAGQPQVVRMHDQQIAAIDAWTAMQEAEISRPEAIRRLVELGLKAKR